VSKPPLGSIAIGLLILAGLCAVSPRVPITASVVLVLAAVVCGIARAARAL
jgi:hypothetical protein